jgi:hypothetical protein
MVFSGLKDLLNHWVVAHGADAVAGRRSHGKR